jgi:hypothetical protein
VRASRSGEQPAPAAFTENVSSGNHGGGVVFDFLKSKVTNAVSDLGEAFGASQEVRIERTRARIRDLDMALDRKRARLEKKLQQRFDKLYPNEAVSNFSFENYVGIDPINFAGKGEESWLTVVAHQIIDKFPGSHTLLSQLDNSHYAFSEANHLKVKADGPYGRLLETRDHILKVYDLDFDIPLYLNFMGGTAVYGCSQPFIVLDRVDLSGLTEREQDIWLAMHIGHIYFGNLKIFAFHRLMDILDKMPSFAGLVQKGLGMIPGIGNTISRGVEIARSVNENLIRKTNMIIGLQNFLRCDRLASIAFHEPKDILGLHTKLCFGSADDKNLHLVDTLIEQGQRIDAQFEAGKIDIHMLAVLGPKAKFGAYRAYKFHEWHQQERSRKILMGYYVTRQKVAEYTKIHAGLEKDIKSEKSKVFEVEEELNQLRNKLESLLMGFQEDDEDPEQDAAQDSVEDDNAKDN